MLKHPVYLSLLFLKLNEVFKVLLSLLGVHLLQVVVDSGGPTRQTSQQARPILNQLHGLAHPDLVASIEVGRRDRSQDEDSEHIEDLFFERVEFP